MCVCVCVDIWCVCASVCVAPLPNSVFAHVCTCEKERGRCRVKNKRKKAITNGGKVRFKEQSFSFLSIHGLKLNQRLSIYMSTVWLFQSSASVQGEREKISVILPARVLLSSRYACVFMGRSYNNKSTA